MKEKLKRTGVCLAALLIVLCMMLGASFGARSVSARADSSEINVSRIMNVVYDDSGSMHNNGSHSWYQAKYSMEIFSALMQENDHMNIYYMSSYVGVSEEEVSRVEPLISIDGNETHKQQNIAEIHDCVTYTRTTPFSSIEGALGDLEEESGYTEKWLIVITDGDEFDDKEQSSDLDALFQDCGREDIRVVYLAIGEDAIVPSETDDVSVYQADPDRQDGGSEILSRVTEICQKIFQRPSYEVIVNGEIELDLPVSELIVFAQGKEVSVGRVDGASVNTVAASITEDDKDKATLNPNADVEISEMYGEIVTFLPESGNYFNEGNYPLEIDAEEYIVYYRPYLEFAVEFEDLDGNEYTGSTLPSGTYRADCYLTYPEGHEKYGERVDTAGLDVSYSKKIVRDGKETEITTDIFELEEGDIELIFRVDYLKYVSVEKKFSVSVRDMQFAFTFPEAPEFDLTKLESSGGLEVSLTNKGEPLTAEEWGGIELSVESDGLDFRIEKGENGIVTLFPLYLGGDLLATGIGDIGFSLEAMLDGSFVAAGSGSLTIVDDRKDAVLALTFDQQETGYSNKNFANESPERTFTVTINGEPLTREQYDSLSFTVDGDGFVLPEVVLDDFREGQPTTGRVQFLPGTDELKDLAGDHDFTVGVEGNYLGQPLSATISDSIAVEDARSAWEIFLDLLPLIITILVIIFLILAYAPIIKHYLPWKITYEYTGGIIPFKNHNPYKSLASVLTVLIPFMSMRYRLKPVDCNELNSFITIKAQRGKYVKCVAISPDYQAGRPGRNGRKDKEARLLLPGGLIYRKDGTQCGRFTSKRKNRR